MSYLEHTTDRLATFVTEHNRLVLVVMLLLTAGVVAGIPQLQAEQQGAFGDEVAAQSDVAQASEYIEERYGPTTGEEEAEGPPTATSHVYVRDEGENVLSRAALLDALAYQRTVLETDAVAEQIADDGVTGPPNLVARMLVGDSSANLDEQYRAVEAADEAEVRAAVERAFADGETAGAFLPASYEPGTAEASSFRMVFTFEIDEAPANQMASPPEDAQRALFDAAAERDDPEFFTLGTHAQEPWIDQQLTDTVWLIVVPALALIVCVLAFAYRDLVDVAIGFVGVVVSVLWMFGILGWLGVPAGMTMIIGPVLIIALSIDFGLHVFMRYREERGPGEEIRAAMRRSTAAVGVAFCLVTATAAIGFLSNLLNPLSLIRELGIGITLGVVSAFVIFVTLVPALKTTADGLLERFGADRRKTPLGKGRVLEPILSGGVAMATRAAPVVVAVALVAGLAGGLAYSELDRQGVQTEMDVADWKTELPGPLAWEASGTAYRQNQDYVEEHYRSDHDFVSVTRFLVEGDPTDPATLARVDAGHAAAEDSDATFRQGGIVRVQSPLSVMEAVAANDDEFAAVYRDADTTGNGVPNRDIADVYDALFEAAPEQAARVIERGEDGTYRSLLLHVPVRQGLDMGQQGEAMHTIADEMEGSADLTVTPVGVATLNNAEMGVLADGILETMLVALSAILALLVVVYRIEHGSALLGAVTVVPIALVVGLVVGSMYIFDVPLTMLTALLMSITIGLGIDYNIHVSDRFAQELDADVETTAALSAAVTGTGGALLGSALTSGVAFATLTLHPSAQISSFGAIVVFALALSFLLSVFVLPSLLFLWAERGFVRDAVGTSAAGADD